MSDRANGSQQANGSKNPLAESHDIHPASDAIAQNTIRIRGARQHNLKDIDPPVMPSPKIRFASEGRDSTI